MKRSIIIFLLFSLLGFCAHAQTRVRGVVTDAQTGEPLPYVSVVFPGTQIGTMTDPEGRFSIEANGSYSNVSFMMLALWTQVTFLRPWARA